MKIEYISSKITVMPYFILETYNRVHDISGPRFFDVKKQLIAGHDIDDVVLYTLL